MRITNGNSTPPPIQSKSDLAPNTLYIDKDGEVHITDLGGKLIAFFRNSGRVVTWRDTSLDSKTFKDLRLVPFTGTISN